jgi:hypothetical protein
MPGRGWGLDSGFDTQEAALNMTLGHQAIHYPPAKVRGDCETDALISTASRNNRRVNANQPALNVYQGTNGVSRIYRRVRLNEIFVHIAGSHPVFCADDTDRYCLAAPNGFPTVRTTSPTLLLSLSANVSTGRFPAGILSNAMSV